MKRTKTPTQHIEPSRGETYNNVGKYAVYEYGTYPRGSVLAGQTRRQWLDQFDSVAEAQAAYPNAVPTHSLFESTRPNLNHLPDNEG